MRPPVTGPEGSWVGWAWGLGREAARDWRREAGIQAAPRGLEEGWGGGGGHEQEGSAQGLLG